MKNLLAKNSASLLYLIAGFIIGAVAGKFILIVLGILAVIAGVTYVSSLIMGAK